MYTVVFQDRNVESVPNIVNLSTQIYNIANDAYTVAVQYSRTYTWEYHNIEVIVINTNNGEVRRYRSGEYVLI